MMIQARSTTYKGIAMRSRLEASWAGAFDNEGWQWTYEPRAYASQDGQYLPDFELAGMKKPTFVEVKGHLEMVDLPDVLARIEIILASIPSAILMLFIGPPDEFVAFQKDGAGSWVVASRIR